MILMPVLASAQKTFQQRTYYDDLQTKLKEVITLTKEDSTLHGEYSSVFENGSLAVKGFYVMGKSDSLWSYYYENGRLKAEGKFINGSQVGIWRYYYESGQYKARGKYDRNIKHGSWAHYYENGKEKSTGIFYNNVKEGIWNYFYEDGELKAQAFFQQGKGNYKEFYPGGQLKSEGLNINDKSEGDWKYFYESGELEAEGPFKNGVREGYWKYYHTNGQLAAEGEFRKGEKYGVWKYYYEDGTISSEGEMVSDQKDGFWKLYYQSGEVKSEAKYDKGSGEYVEYYPNGKQKSRGNMINGLREGSWKYFGEDGREDGKAEFLNGEGDYEGYYPDGSVKMTGKIKDGKRIGKWVLYNPDGSVAGTYTPVYEEQKPIFRATNLNEEATKRAGDKPEYRYKNNKIRYFNSTINEYTGVIIGSNPVMPTFGQLPISVEYYKQERLGYELNMVMHKDPFYNNTTKIIGPPHTLGLDLHLRQKFYHNDSKAGMFYFGHEILTGYLQHKSEVKEEINQMTVWSSIMSDESRFAYGLFIGDRWMQRTNDSGMTIDFNIGFAMGYRNFRKKVDPKYYSYFDELNQDKFYLPVIFTLNVGFAGPKRRTTSF